MRTRHTGDSVVAAQRHALGTLHWCAAFASGIALIAGTPGLPLTQYHGRLAGANMAVVAAWAMWPYVISWHISRQRVPGSRVRMWLFLVVLVAATAAEVVLISAAVGSEHPLYGLAAVTSGEAVVLAAVGNSFDPEA